MEEMNTQSTEVAEVTTTDETIFEGWQEEIEENNTEEVAEEATEENTTEAEEEPETEEVEEETEDQEEEQEEDAKTLDYGDIDIKYLGEDKKLKDLEPQEVGKLVQKGLNHDRIKEQLEPIKDLAGLYGIDLTEMSNMLFNDYFKFKANKEGTTEAIERKQYELDNREKKAKLDAELKENAENEAKAKEQSKQSMLKEFVNVYPDIESKDIPQEVWDTVKNGSKLVDAFARYENAQLKKQIQKLSKQIENKATSPVKGNKYGSNSNSIDPTFDGWD